MPELASFDYAIVRVVPRVEREEFVNAGVILFCRTRGFLEARLALDSARLATLAPHLDLAAVERALAVIPLVCRGAAAGPIGQLSQAERFHWLVAPRSAIIQTSPVHCGLCADPAVALGHLLATMVRLPPPGGETEHGIGTKDIQR